MAVRDRALLVGVTTPSEFRRHSRRRCPMRRHLFRALMALMPVLTVVVDLGYKWW